MIKKPELLAPAGSFSSAFYAYSNGADAVYLGLKDFSARKSARNFTIDELRRLKQYAADREKKVYITLNTIIKEKEFPALNNMLKKLAVLKIDGIIIQDPGVLNFVREQFPSLPLHASTQMAIHTSEGIEALANDGIKRIILARELSIEEIHRLQIKNPDTELEVFIHGALCYSFSGLCLASGTLLGRSANRGECGQICRTWFNGDTGRGYYFSMKDLAAFKHIKTLQKIGIASLKIEGRMKSPEYTGLTTNLYRKLLDGDLTPAEWDNSSKDSRTTFSRHQNDYWLAGQPKAPVVEPSYPSHRGIEAGRVLHSDALSFSLRTRTELSIRDGLLFFKEGSPLHPINFGIKKMKGPSGENITSAPRGISIWIISSLRPPEGTLLYKTSAHNLHWPEVKTKKFPVWKRKLDISLILTDTGIQIKADTVLGRIEYQHYVIVEHARNPKNFRKLLEDIFNASHESWFTLGNLSFSNQTRLDDNSIFIPPSKLKSLKKEFYRKADALLLETPVLNTINQPEHRSKKQPVVPANPIPRTMLVPKTYAPIPFVLFHKEFPLSDLPVVNSKRYLPLMPVTFNSSEYLSGVKNLILKYPDEHFVIGLNNIGHITWAQDLADNPRISFFIDYGIYIANHYAYEYLEERIPRIEFGYFWIEGLIDDYYLFMEKVTETLTPGFPVYFIEKEFSPHLFLSRGCYTNMMNGGICPNKCPKEFTYHLSQKDRRFNVKVENCLTWLFKGK